MSGETGNRYAAIDGLRGLLALYVMLVHCGHRTWDKTNIPLPFMFFEVGHIAVAMFIVISGFCLMLPILTHSGHQRGVWYFFKRRIIRIFPSCIAAALLGALALYLTHQSIGTWKTALLNLFFFQDYAVRSLQGWNGPLWSVAVEERVYFAFALILVPLWKRIPLWALVLGCFVVTMPLSWITYKTPWDWSYPHFLGLFALGMVGATAFRKGWWNRLPYFAIIAPCLLVAAILQGWLYYDDFGYWPYYIIDTCTGIATALLIVWALRRPESIFTVRPFVFVGERSYSLYVYHIPIMTLLKVIIPATASLAWKGAFWMAMYPVILGLCYIGYLLIELPCVNYLNRMATKLPIQPSCIPAGHQSARSLPA